MLTQWNLHSARRERGGTQPLIHIPTRIRNLQNTSDIWQEGTASLKRRYSNLAYSFETLVHKDWLKL